MFTGIIETVGRIVDLKEISGNVDLIVASPISKELKIDQSVSPRPAVAGRESRPQLRQPQGRRRHQ